MQTVPNPVALAADGSDALRQLLSTQQVHVDYLKVGPWLGLARMQVCAQHFPVLLHLHNPLVTSQIDLQAILALISQTKPPWVSFHLGLSENTSLWQRLGIPIPLVRRGKARQQAIDNLQALQTALDLPIAIENQAHHRHSGHDYLVDPLFIRDIVQTTKCWFLLDLGHARVSAAMRGESDMAYLHQLPLEHVIEIHISSPVPYRGRLRDLHHELTETDYQLLQSVRPHCPNLKAVTLEYYGEISSLIKQLHHLRTLLDYSAIPTTVST